MYYIAGHTFLCIFWTIVYFHGRVGRAWKGPMSLYYHRMVHSYMDVYNAIPCYLNCSNFFTAPICHCLYWLDNTFLYRVHIFVYRLDIYSCTLSTFLTIVYFYQSGDNGGKVEKGHLDIKISHSASTTFILTYFPFKGPSSRKL